MSMLSTAELLRSARPRWKIDRSGGSSPRRRRRRHSQPFAVGPVFVILILTLAAAPEGSRASFGDQSHVFMSCIHNCFFGNCSTEGDVSRFEHRQPWHLRLLGWDCEDECGHQCMWKTVDYFDSFDERVQFRGKWPFVRWLGLQEPASVFFSLLNLFAHIYGWSEFSRRVAPNNRFYALWKTHAYLAMNAWLWSTAFHSRDIPITEFMDYFGAFSIVLYSLYALVARMIMDKLESAVQWLVQVAFICFFIFHLYYMLNVKFDYQYHITLNITTGIINSAGWLYWTWTNRGRPYAAKCAFVVISLLALSSLEVLDFSPVWFIFDAHSLWHLGTAPLPLIWYRFLIDDCRYENIKAKAQPTVPAATGRTLTRRGFARVKELLKEINVLNIHNDDGFTLD